MPLPVLEIEGYVPGFKVILPLPVLLGLHVLLLPEHVPLGMFGGFTLSGSAAGAIPVVGGLGWIEPEPVLL